MWSTGRAVGMFLVASLALLATSAPAAAAPKPITGELSKRGYTVVALATNGEARVAGAARRSFSLRPPARQVTLHLIAPRGKYAGPVVVGRKARGRRAILGVRAGARLGLIGIRRGHARVARTLPREWVDASRVARARRGVPLGARAFGRVRSRPPRRSLAGDRDLDGVHNLFDIDDDGDLVLDSLDRSGAGRRAQASAQFDGFSHGFMVDLPDVLNANATGVTLDQIDSLMVRRGGFIFFESFPGNDPAELDCGSDDPETPEREGLPYCSQGDPPSTGRAPPRGDPGAPRETWSRFPDDFDPDGDGFGTVSGPGGIVGFGHGATSSQIGTGDTLTIRFATGETVPVTLEYVAVTTHALMSYDDGAGHSKAISYPVPGPDPDGSGANQPCDTGTKCSGPGTRGNPFPVRARTAPCPDPSFCEAGDVVVTLSFWRPQRARLTGDRAPGSGDSATWTDIGGLGYGISAGASEGCREAESGGLLDRALDGPANPANMFTYSLNLTKCLARDDHPGTLTPGEATPVQFLSSAPSPSKAQGGAAVTVFFKQVP